MSIAVFKHPNQSYGRASPIYLARIHNLRKEYLI